MTPFSCFQMNSLNPFRRYHSSGPRSQNNISDLTCDARRGTLNLVGTEPLDDLARVDVGRLHYDYIAFLGTNTTDIADSYDDSHNRHELRPGGTAVFVGAGGPMGQMHVQYAIENPDGPAVVIATEVNEERIKNLKASFAPLAENTFANSTF